MSFAPAHLSLLFHIHPDDDPLLHGSTGLGICLPQGAYAALERHRRSAPVSPYTKANAR